MNEWTNEGLDWNQGAFPPWSWSKLTHVRGRTGCTGTKLSFWTISSREGFEMDQCLRPEQSEGGSKNPAGGDWGSSEGRALSEQLPGSRSRGRGWEGSAQEGVPGAWLVNLSAAQQHSSTAKGHSMCVPCGFSHRFPLVLHFPPDILPIVFSGIFRCRELWQVIPSQLLCGFTLPSVSFCQALHAGRKPPTLLCFIFTARSVQYFSHFCSSFVTEEKLCPLVYWGDISTCVFENSIPTGDAIVCVFMKFLFCLFWLWSN